MTPASLRLDLKCGKGAISEGEKCTKGAAQRVQPANKFVRVPKDYPGRKQPYGVGFRSKTENALIASGQIVSTASVLANAADLVNPPAFGTTRLPYGTVATSVGGALIGIGAAAKAHRLSRERTTEGKPVSKTQQKNIKSLRKQAVYGLTMSALGAGFAYGTYKRGQRQNITNLATKLGTHRVSDPQRSQLENLYASSASQRLRNRQNTFGTLAVLKGRITQSAQRRRLERLVKRRDSVYADGFSPDLAQLAI